MTTNNLRAVIRDLYPSILEASSTEWAEFRRSSQSSEENDWVDSLKADCDVINKGIKILHWPNKIIVDEISRQTQVLYQSTVQDYNNGLVDQKDVEVFQLRSSKSMYWVRAFDAFESADPSSIPPYAVELMHDDVARGHLWFGVGEWAMALFYYIRALTHSLASGNNPGTQVCVRFVVDTYTAAHDSTSASAISKEILDSDLMRLSAYFGTEYIKDAFESVALSFAFERNGEQATWWINQITNRLKSKPTSEIDKTNIANLLREVYQFRKDAKNMTELRNAISFLLMEDSRKKVESLFK